MDRRQNSSREPLKLFFSYAREDREFVEEFKTHLTVLTREQYIQVWDDLQLNPGDNWEQTITSNLLSADIVLLLISPNFLASDFIYSKELSVTLERLRLGKARAVPILIRPTDWRNSPISNLPVLPNNGVPIILWENRDTAMLNVIDGIRTICEKLLREQAFENEQTFSSVREKITEKSLKQSYRFDDVFVKSGMPHVTFVARADFKRLKFAIAKPGRGVVIEGPSGIGKTTAVKRAIEEISSSPQARFSNASITLLSARKQKNLREIEALETWHRGTVIIDDFHRLDKVLQQQVVDYLKYLADTEPESKKLVIIGIPHTRQKLVEISFDVATRIDAFALGKVEDIIIQTMIEKGEEALNIRFVNKAEIVKVASGSLNIAQYICYNICSNEDILETQEQQQQRVHCDMKTIATHVMEDLSLKFSQTLHHFAALDGQMSSISLRLLEELAHTEDGFLSLSVLKNKRPDLAPGIDRFINEKWMDTLYQMNDASKNQLFFDPLGAALVADDPQLTFYLRKTRFSQLAKEVGKVASSDQCKVFVSYSHRDVKWLRRLQVHLKPLEQEDIIDLWADTKIPPGAVWQDKIQEALDTASVALVLVSADFLASDFIKKHELPKLLSRAASGGTTIIPIILSPCLFEESQLSVYQAANPPAKPLSASIRATQEQILMQVARTVSNRLKSEEA